MATDPRQIVKRESWKLLGLLIRMTSCAIVECSYACCRRKDAACGGLRLNPGPITFFLGNIEFPPGFFVLNISWSEKPIINIVALILLLIFHRVPLSGNQARTQQCDTKWGHPIKYL